MYCLLLNKIYEHTEQLQLQLADLRTRSEQQEMEIVTQKKQHHVISQLPGVVQLSIY